MAEARIALPGIVLPARIHYLTDFVNANPITFQTYELRLDADINWAQHFSLYLTKFFNQNILFGAKYFMALTLAQP